ncbi:hypothetical protein SAMN06266787_11114 [Halorubrum ezzemoulense]|uniref:Transcriptional regulator n=2 Tax=Halorubrum ezzemoulense TaxID=337243 RepID=A0A238YE06_HALEZ|nr:hypothetical protein SAMN06266787_11114 [Halorubrum ezzemoulense]
MSNETDAADPNAPSMTRGERIRAAARTLRTPRTASWVAEETETTTKTAQKYLDQLVEDTVLQKIERGGQTLYCVDQLMATYREVATLQREHDREELADVLESMRARIAEWEAEYDVESPSELLASVADVDTPDGAERRREIASEWDHLADRLPVVKAALKEYDWATDRDGVPV